jgi:hypothetical protein
MCKACEATFDNLKMAHDGHKVMFFVLDPDTKDYTMASNLDPLEQLKVLNSHVGMVLAKAFPDGNTRNEPRRETGPFDGIGI